MEFDLSDEQKLFCAQMDKGFAQLGGLAPVRLLAQAPCVFLSLIHI